MNGSVRCASRRALARVSASEDLARPRMGVPGDGSGRDADDRTRARDEVMDPKTTRRAPERESARESTRSRARAESPARAKVQCRAGPVPIGVTHETTRRLTDFTNIVSTPTRVFPFGKMYSGRPDRRRGMRIVDARLRSVTRSRTVARPSRPRSSLRARPRTRWSTTAHVPFRSPRATRVTRQTPRGPPRSTPPRAPRTARAPAPSTSPLAISRAPPHRFQNHPRPLRSPLRPPRGHRGAVRVRPWRFEARREARPPPPPRGRENFREFSARRRRRRYARERRI